MINSSDALRIILENVHPIGTEKLLLAKSLARTFARDIVAHEDLPPFDNSSMDGFALSSSDLNGASGDHPCVLRIIGESSAGNAFSGRIKAGQSVRVMTGGVLPRGADSVVPIEDAIEMDGETVRFSQSASPGRFVRKSGEDIKRGEVILKEGTAITPPSLGVLAALGRERVRVYKKPCVNIVATGNELVDLLAKPGKGKIRNSTSYGLAGYVVEAGGMPELMGIAGDREKALRKRLSDGLKADVLLVTGGVSVGKYDLVQETLSALGVEVKFWKVNIKPGRPFLFGVRKSTLVFGLPGNPVSTYVTFLQFVRPALLAMTGIREIQPLRLTAVLDQEFSKSDGKRHFVRGIAVRRSGELHVTTTGTQSSGAMSSMSRANCLMIIPEDSTNLHRGDSVDIELLPHCGYIPDSVKNT